MSDRRSHPDGRTGPERGCLSRRRNGVEAAARGEAPLDGNARNKIVENGDRFAVGGGFSIPRAEGADEIVPGNARRFASVGNNGIRNGARLALRFLGERARITVRGAVFAWAPAALDPVACLEGSFIFLTGDGGSGREQESATRKQRAANQVSGSRKTRLSLGRNTDLIPGIVPRRRRNVKGRMDRRSGCR
jgi:hypothetical protein